MESQYTTVGKSREELFNECCDLRVPVTRFDNIEVLEGYLRAASDECSEKPEVPAEDELADDPVYIGKRPIIETVLRKVFFFL
jgi:hypothetical protein